MLGKGRVDAGRSWGLLSACVLAGLLLFILSAATLHSVRLRPGREGDSRALPVQRILRTDNSGLVHPADPRIPEIFYGHIFRSRARGNSQRAICLTFDDGPSKVYTPKVLDILREKDVRATFFVVGRNVKRHPDLARRIYDEGHVVGNHSYNHTRRKKIADDDAAWQVDGTTALIEGITGERPFVYRPPFGRVHNNMMTNAARYRYYAIVLWTIDSQDCAHASSQTIFQSCLRNLKAGDILLFHDGGENRQPMIEALPFIIDAARMRGFQFVTVPELLRLAESEAKEKKDRRNG